MGMQTSDLQILDQHRTHRINNENQSLKPTHSTLLGTSGGHQIRERLYPKQNDVK